jgi:hypothetical protein
MIFRLLICFGLAAVVVGCGLRYDSADATHQAAFYAAAQQQVARENRLADEERAYQRTLQEQARQDGRFWFALVLAGGACAVTYLHWQGKIRHAEIVTGFEYVPPPPYLIENPPAPRYNGGRLIVENRSATTLVRRGEQSMKGVDE